MHKNNVLIFNNTSIDIETIQTIYADKFNLILVEQTSQALDTIKTTKISLILFDIEESSTSMLEFISKLNEDIKFKNIPFIVFVKTDEQKLYDEIPDYENIHLIKKPFHKKELLLKTNIAIKQYKYIKNALEQAKELEQYKKILDESDIISKSDLHGKITYVNKKFVEISGYTQEELLGKPHSFVRHPDMNKEIFIDMWQKITNKELFQGVIKNKKKDGSSYYVDATVMPILDIEGNIKEYIGLRHDITDIMNPKRQFIDDILSTKTPISILGRIKNYVLLKEFYGETFMGKVEDYISTNIMLLVPKESPLTKVYQLENGEFGFLREADGCSPTNIELCLRKFQNHIKNNNFIIDNKKIDIEFSFVYTYEKNEGFENLKIGIYKAQKEKIDLLYVDGYSQKQKLKAQNNIKIVNILKDAVYENGTAKLVSYFQPIYNNKTDTIDKYESLIRLINHDGAVISPYFFIDIAKNAGYYKDITNIVIQNTQKALSQTDKDITINLSTIDIEDLEVRNILLDLMSKPQNYGRIVFELLEDEVASDFDTVKDFIGLAKVIGGVKIAIDDFGSGYSNFERLLDFQPDILKIDGSLIKNIVQDSFSRHVVEAIVLFAKKENIQTVAEFIADEDIFNEVKKFDIDYSQGFFIGKPDILK